MKRKIYLASSWRNEFQPTAVALLKYFGHEVYDFKNPAPGNHGFQWSEIDPACQQWPSRKFINALDHPVAIEGFRLDFEAMAWADAGVLLLPCGKSAHLEAGYFIGAGKDLFIYLADPCEPELMYAMADKCFDSFLDLVAFITDDGQLLTDEQIAAGSVKAVLTGECENRDIMNTRN
jgi:nucleoside 2-deoxyribosyltransferase